MTEDETEEEEKVGLFYMWAYSTFYEGCEIDILLEEYTGEEYRPYREDVLNSIGRAGHRSKN